MNNLNKIKLLLVLLAFLLGKSLAAVDVQQLMQKVDDLPKGKTMSAQMTLTIKAQRGKVRKRQLTLFNQDTPSLNSTIFFVRQPASLNGSAYLVEDASVGGNSIWLYLPVVKRPRRLAGGDQKKSFLSSDLSYADLAPFEWVADYQLSWVKSDQVDGLAVELVEALPNEAERQRTGYQKAMLYVDPQRSFILQAVFWLDDQKVKYLQNEDIKLIDGILIAETRKVFLRKDKKVSSQTEVQLSEVRINQALNLEFKPYQLEKGLPQ